MSQAVVVAVGVTGEGHHVGTVRPHPVWATSSQDRRCARERGEPQERGEIHALLRSGIGSTCATSRTVSAFTARMTPR